MRNKPFWKSTDFWIQAAEVVVIFLFAYFLTKPYMNMDPDVLPAGRETNSTIYYNHFWTDLLECGECAFWNGYVQGGYPALTDLRGLGKNIVLGSLTMLLGVVNGVKISILLSVAMVGLGQWIMAKQLKIRWLPRIWGSFIAMAGGYLLGKMELGAFNMVLASGFAALIPPSIVYIVKGGKNKGAVLLGISTALVLGTSIGRMPIAIVAWLPAFLILILDKEYKLNGKLKYFVFAAIIALFLAALSIIPFLNNSSGYTKAPTFDWGSVQPMKYFVLNFVIDDFDYYLNQSLTKLPFPFLYNHFIGWLSIIFVVYGLFNIKKEHKRLLWFYISIVGLTFLVGQGDLLKFLSENAGSFGEWLRQLRMPMLSVRFAMPFLLAVATYGFDRLLDLDWPRLNFSVDENNQNRFQVSLHWLLLIPLIVNISNAHKTYTYWVSSVAMIEESDRDVLIELTRDDLQWASTPFGEHYWIEPAVQLGLKLSPGIVGYSWDHITVPEPRFLLNRGYIEDINAELIYDSPDTNLKIYEFPDRHYAFVENDDGDIYPCKAYGKGGNIEVVCEEIPFDGLLIVQENDWDGWKVWVDEDKSTLEKHDFLAVKTQKGSHTYQFEFRPFDVYLSLVFKSVGVILCGVLWFYDVDELKNFFIKGKSEERNEAENN